MFTAIPTHFSRVFVADHWRPEGGMEKPSNERCFVQFSEGAAIRSNRGTYALGPYLKIDVV